MGDRGGMDAAQVDRAGCLWRARTRQGMTQVELAKAVGVHQRTVQNWETRTTSMGDAVASVAARVLNDPRVRWGDDAPAKYLAIGENGEAIRVFRDPDPDPVWMVA